MDLPLIPNHMPEGFGIDKDVVGHCESIHAFGDLASRHKIPSIVIVRIASEAGLSSVSAVDAHYSVHTPHHHIHGFQTGYQFSPTIIVTTRLIPNTVMPDLIRYPVSFCLIKSDSI